jgi:hypothetical protein
MDHAGRALHGRRARMLMISDKHLQAFAMSSGVLMVSPFLPEGLKHCQWCAASADKTFPHVYAASKGLPVHRSPQFQHA